MADGKLDLPADLAPKVDPSGGNDDMKGIVGCAVDSKDQGASENSIPLSPQWLHSRPNESKIGLSAASGKDNWRLDGLQEKKEWRRNLPDIESSRRWHEEERETGLLGRRERRKEGDKENEHRKNERRPENISRETADSRTSLSSERRHQIGSRNSGHESRRDSKWSSRWGPEDKQKDTLIEKKMDADKEDAGIEKQSSLGSNHQAPESDSRDKWRPRHRQDVFSSGSSVHHAAPGFGFGRGRGEGSNVGFGPGRGRASAQGSYSSSRLSASGPIGAAPGSKRMPSASLVAYKYRYPRGKLLDIYRKQKTTPSFDSTAVDLEDIPLVTESSSIAPLAFVTPDEEEEALLKDISNGKIVSSEESSDSGRDSLSRGVSSHRDYKDEFHATIDGAMPVGLTSTKDGDHSNIQIPGIKCSDNEQASHKISPSFADELMENPFLTNNYEDVNKDSSVPDYLKLPDDSNSLFNTSFIVEGPQTSDYNQISNSETKQSEEGNPADELTLFYRDPQGEIQGPFLGVDIISWFEQGFFGLELPVCLSNAPEGTPFRQLGEVMSYLSCRSQTDPVTITNGKYEPSDSLERSMPSSGLSCSVAINGQPWTSTDFEEPQVPPIASKLDNLANSQYELLPLSSSETSSGIIGGRKHKIHKDAEQDVEEVLYSGRPQSRSENSSGMLTHELHVLAQSPSGNHLRGTDLGETGLNHKALPNGDVYPFGLSWSELEKTYPKRPLSLNLSSITDGRSTHTPTEENNRGESLTSIHDPAILNAWPSKHRIDASSDVLHNSLHATRLPQLELESNQFSLEGHLLNQQCHKAQIQQNQLLPTHQRMHLTGPVLDQGHGILQRQLSSNQYEPEIENLLKLQLQQQQQIQLQQQQQMHNHRQHIQRLQQQQQQQQLLHDQQLHRQMQLLHHLQQQQQQQEQQQLLREQFVHQKLHDPAFDALQVDALRERGMIEALSSQRLLHEMQQQSHHLQRQHDLSIEQLIQAKFGHNLHHEQHEDLLHAVPRSRQRQMLSMEQQLLFALQQEQLQAQQLPMVLRPRADMAEERHIGGIRSVNESAQFGSSAARLRHIQSPGSNQLDILQRQGPSVFEQPGNLESLLLQERILHGHYEPNSEPFERSIPMSQNIPRTNADLLNILPQLQELKMHGLHDETHSYGKMGHLPSGIPSRQHQHSNQLTGSHANSLENQWYDTDDKLGQKLIEPQFNRFHLEGTHRGREMNFNCHADDSNAWTSISRTENLSRQGLVDLLQPNISIKSSKSAGSISGVPMPSTEVNEAPWPFSGSSGDHAYNLLGDQVGMAEQINNIENPGRFGFHTNSGSLNEHQQFLSAPTEIQKIVGADIKGADAYLSSVSCDPVEEIRGKRHGSDSSGMALEIDSLEGGVEQTGGSFIKSGELKVSAPIRHASFSSTGGRLGFSNNGVGFNTNFGEEIANDRISTRDLIGGVDTLSTPATLPGLASRPHTRERSLLKYTPAEESRQEARGISVVQSSDSTVAERDVMRICRRDPRNDADAPEASSFVDMLKSTKKPTTLEGDASAGALDAQDAGSSGRSAKKKGKKGRQIDPSLLGFKVHSNRIMMGEIQRPDD